MSPKFLREEAARFRVMAEENTREASKQRLLGMAADYDARATAADGLQPAQPAAPAIAEEMATAEDAATTEEPAPRSARIDPTARSAKPDPNAAAPARRGVGRPRLRLGT